MRNKLLGASAALLASTMLTPANATVNVEAEVYKDKDVTVTETITITKTVLIQAEYVATLDHAAEALAIHNVTNSDNTVFHSPLPGETDPDGIDRTATIQQSVGSAPGGESSGNSGIVGVNQDVGDNTNQGILVAVGVTEDDDNVADAQASAEQTNTGNTVNWPGPDALDIDADTITVTAIIQGSVSHNNGIVGVNQNGGNNNNQTNAVAAAVGLNLVGGEGVALAEADLGQLNSGNNVSEINTQKSATIGRSVIGNSGIVGVNQAVGSNSNQANIVAISANLPPPPTQ